MAGSRYASVLPLPVGARQSRSCPASAAGQACDCTGVGREKPRCSIARPISLGSVLSASDCTGGGQRAAAGPSVAFACAKPQASPRLQLPCCQKRQARVRCSGTRSRRNLRSSSVAASSSCGSSTPGAHRTSRQNGSSVAATPASNLPPFRMTTPGESHSFGFSPRTVSFCGSGSPSGPTGSFLPFFFFFFFSGSSSSSSPCFGLYSSRASTCFRFFARPSFRRVFLSPLASVDFLSRRSVARPRGLALAFCCVDIPIVPARLGWTPTRVGYPRGGREELPTMNTQTVRGFHPCHFASFTRALFSPPPMPLARPSASPPSGAGRGASGITLLPLQPAPPPAPPISSGSRGSHDRSPQI